MLSEVAFYYTSLELVFCLLILVLAMNYVLKNFLLIFVVLVLCNGEDRKIYLVLMEGDPVAFHQIKTSSEKGNKLDPNRY